MKLEEQAVLHRQGLQKGEELFAQSDRERASLSHLDSLLDFAVDGYRREFLLAHGSPFVPPGKEGGDPLQFLSGEVGAGLGAHPADGFTE